MSRGQKIAATKAKNKKRRYRRIQERFNEIYSFKYEGVKLDFNGVVEKVAYEFGVEPATIQKALKEEV